jgi:hypothetical protein
MSQSCHGNASGLSIYTTGEGVGQFISQFLLPLLQQGRNVVNISFILIPYAMAGLWCHHM